VSSVDQVVDPVELSLAVSAEVGDAILAQAPHHKQSAVVAWLLEEEHCLLSAAAGFDRLADVVLNVAGDAVAAGFQAVAVALQAADGLLDCPVILRIDRPAVALSHVGEHKVRRLQGFQRLIPGVISFVMVLLARWMNPNLSARSPHPSPSPTPPDKMSQYFTLTFFFSCHVNFCEQRVR
jgi:hypothetical protein